MKPVALLIAISLLLCFAACKGGEAPSESSRAAADDPIYNDSAAFNDLNEPADSLTEESVVDISGSTAADQSLQAAVERFFSALGATEKLLSYRMTSMVSVAVEIEGTSVELEKATAKRELDKNGDFYVSRQIDLKDTHNNSISQTLEEIYGSKSSAKQQTRTTYASYVSNGEDYISTKQTSYKQMKLASAVGALYNAKATAFETVTTTEADGVATFKFSINEASAAALAREELASAGISVKTGDITSEQFNVTAVIDADEVLVAFGVSARLSVGDTVYVITREFSVSDKNSDGILCTKPEWA